jgi:PAS domain S-box-containing protein
MNLPARLRIVYLEDDESAFELVRSLLAVDGLECELVHAFDETGYRSALTPVPPDAILSDYNLPTMDGITALNLRQALCPDVPFIFVSGALGEAMAIDLLKSGVTDFVFKDTLPRLAPSIRRCLAEAREHRERMRAEFSLRESEERFRRLAENAPDVIFRYRVDIMPGRCEFISGAVERLSGYRSAEFYARPLLAVKIVHPEDRHIVRAVIERRELPRDAAEIRWIAKDGRVIVTEQRFVPIHDAAGRLMAVEGIARDITDRKRTEEQVALLSRAIAESPVGVDITDSVGRLAFVSDPLCAMSGYSREELLGRPLDILHSPLNASGVRDQMREKLRQGFNWQGELLCRRKTGEDYLVRATMSPLRDAQGRMRHCIAVKEDITEWKREQEGRRLLEAQLFQAQKMESIGTLAGGIAHDFNNILTGILGFTEIAAMSLNPADPGRSALDEVRKAGLRARDLVAQILTFSRQREVRQVPLDLGRAVAEALKFLRASAPANIRIERNLAAGTISADPTQLHQIVLNLCTNALHAMRGGPGTLSVAVEPVAVDEALAATMPKIVPGDYLCLRVTDTGHGMDEETLRRVFDPFFTTKQPGEGTGLGLAVVQGIVSVHGGGITVESQPGLGSTFRVFFPPSTDAAAEAVAATRWP